MTENQRIISEYYEAKILGNWFIKINPKVKTNPKDKKKIRRAKGLINTYRKADKNYNRGECTLDAQWVVDNVFSGQVCCYCGESDWHKLGCDRKDSSLPHTPENCVPCCLYCNLKKSTIPYDEFMRRIGKIV